MEFLHQLGIDPRILLLQAVGFIILYLLLRRFLFGPIQSLLDQRRADVELTLDRSAEELKKAESLRADYETHLAEIREEARQRIQEAVRDGEQARDAMLADARGQAQAMLGRAESQIELETRQAMLALRDDVVDLAIEAARKAIHGTLDEARHREVIDRAIADLEGAGPS
jgi:F-type H+-transporting ATPase subunit b